MNKVVGIENLPVPIYCHEDSLTEYDVTISGIQIKIYFPKVLKDENGVIGTKSLQAPLVANKLRKADEELLWGLIERKTSEMIGASVYLVAVECDEKDAQFLYEVFNQWWERFQKYCFLCNKQPLHATNAIIIGGNYLELVNNKGYIHPEKPINMSITVQIKEEEVFLRKVHIEKAIAFASSMKQIRSEYKFLLQAYEAEERHEHRLAIVNVSSALEMCLMTRISEYCTDHNLEESIIFDKYRYLMDLVRLTKKIDARFSMFSEAKRVVEIRNDVLHCNRNPYPTQTMAYEAIKNVEGILGQFYEDYADT